MLTAFDMFASIWSFIACSAAGLSVLKSMFAMSPPVPPDPLELPPITNCACMPAC